MNQLGGHAVYLTEDTIMGARESVHDVARNLERFVDAIVARTGPHAVVAELAEQASIPVINGLTLRAASLSGARRHVHDPERFGRLEGIVLAFVGDGNNVYHSLALVGAVLGMEVRLAHPAGYAPTPRSSSALGPSRPFGGGWSSPRTRWRRSAARTSSTPTPGPRWARKPRPRSAATRSAAFASTRRCSRRPVPRPSQCIVCRPTAVEITSGHGRPPQHHLGPVREPAPRRGPAGRGDRWLTGEGSPSPRPSAGDPSLNGTRTPCGQYLARVPTRPRSRAYSEVPRSRRTGRCPTRRSAASS